VSEPADGEPDKDAKPAVEDAKSAPEAKAEAKAEEAEAKAEKADAKTEAKAEKAEAKTEAKVEKAEAKVEKAEAKVDLPEATAKEKPKAKFDDDGVVRERNKVPPTRQHEVPAERPSGLSLTPPVTYPNDGPVSARMRRADGYLGIVEQVILVSILASVVCTAAAAAISDKVFGHQLGRWWFDIVRSRSP